MAVDYFKSLRYTVLGFQILFMISGIVLITLGTEAISAYTENSQLLFISFNSVPTFSIVIGSLNIVIAIFGLFALYRSNYWMTVIFSLLLLLIFIFELSASIAGYVLRNNIDSFIYSEFGLRMKDYKSEYWLQDKWDKLQTKFECCGKDSYKDWIDILIETPQQQPYDRYSSHQNDIYSSLNRTSKQGYNLLPISCCEIPIGTIGKATCFGEIYNKRLRPKGCFGVLADYLKFYIGRLSDISIIFALFQLFGIFFSTCLAWQIKKRKSADKTSHLNQNVQQSIAELNQLKDTDTDIKE